MHSKKIQFKSSKKATRKESRIKQQKYAEQEEDKEWTDQDSEIDQKETEKEDNTRKIDRMFRELSAEKNSESDKNSDIEETKEHEIKDTEEITLDQLSQEELEEDAVPRQRITINNKVALKRVVSELKLELPWIETQTLISSQPIIITDVNNDMERELAFYKQALGAAMEGRARLLESGIPFSRPDDYFAEMVKSDEQMARIRQRLLDESQKIKVGEDARRQRELKKFGKKVQIEKIQERQKQKSQDLDKIKAMKKKRKGIEDTALNDDFDIALEEAATSDKRPNKWQKTGAANKKRITKDSKFGFGGKKRFSKSNTAESSGDIEGFNPKKMKDTWGASPGKSKKFVKKRPVDRNDPQVSSKVHWKTRPDVSHFKQMN
ncbi:hypothetical protein G9A89_021939 [Geosiphon pyriformis]|nr:hypothetical protein G9A89_021939 [Geosiphon pyriformis]